MKEGEEPSLPEPIPLERARRRRQEPPAKERWEIASVAHYLKAQPLSVQDPRLGEGSRLLIGITEPPVTALDLFPAASAARISCRGMLLELIDVAAPLLPNEEMSDDEETIALVNRSSGNDLRVGLNAQGDVSLFIAPHQPLEMELLSVVPEPQQPAVKEAPDETSQGVGSNRSEKKEAQERVVLTGRVGADPVFRTTLSSKQMIGRFPLAVHDHDDATTWHQVLVFGERAQRLKGTIQKGESVQVVGYLHRNERQGGDGAKREVEEVYAVAINKPDVSAK